MPVPSHYQQLVDPLLRFRSVSTDKAYQPEIKRLVRWLQKHLSDRGFAVRVVRGYGNPLIIASYEADPALPTMLIYGHYDVQPAAEDEGWESDPFTLVERDGRLFGRGVVDNKGQVGVHVATVLKLIEEGALGYNIKFLLEGDEETGSAQMAQFVADFQDDLQADVILISDGEVVAGSPVIERGFRGCFNATLRVRTAAQDVHSGMFGGAIPNAAGELLAVLGKLHAGSPAQVAVAGWEDDLAPLDSQTLAHHQALPFGPDTLRELIGVQTHFTRSAEVDFYSQVTLFPAIEVTGFQAGYSGEGYRNSIPAQAVAKLNCRTAPSQDPVRLVGVLREWLAQQLPDYVEWELETDVPSAGVEISIENPYVERAREVLRQVYGQEPFVKHVGGTLPIITLFNEVLEVPQVVVPLANEDCGMHSPNENFELEQLNKALAFSEAFLRRE